MKAYFTSCRNINSQKNSKSLDTHRTFKITLSFKIFHSPRHRESRWALVNLSSDCATHSNFAREILETVKLRISSLRSFQTRSERGVSCEIHPELTSLVQVSPAVTFFHHSEIGTNRCKTRLEQSCHDPQRTSKSHSSAGLKRLINSSSIPVEVDYMAYPKNELNSAIF